jgi:DNA-binding winged helix-turn-helix (wHTH) protein/Tol biopolymer transport system component
MQNRVQQIFSFAEFELNAAHRRLARHGEVVTLHAKAFDLLVFLVENAGHVVTREEILDTVWEGQTVEEANLTVQISALRKILREQKNAPRFLITVPGKGYKFIADVRTDEAIAIESHSFVRLIVEEEITENENQPTGHQTVQLTANLPVETFPRLTRTGKKVLPVAAILGVLLVGAFGYGLYQQNNRRQNLAQRWINPTLVTEPRQLTANGKVSCAALSPDSNYYAYNVWQTDLDSLWFAHINGKQQIQIRPPEAVTYRGLTFAPHGNEIYYVVRDSKNPRGALFRIAVFGGAPQKVLADIESPVTFSPDGKQLAFVRSDAERKLSVLVVADAENGALERELATRPATQFFSSNGAAWSPDGKQIAVAAAGETASTEDLLLVSTQDGQAEKFGTTAWRQVRRIAWLGDGSGLFLNIIEKDNWEDRHLWLLEYPGGQAHKITRDLFQYGANSLSVSDDGTKLVAVKSIKVSNISVSPAEALAQHRKITSNAIGKRDGGDGLAWTADGRIVFSASFDKNQTIWRMDADGANARQLTTPDFEDRFPTLTKDNRYVVFQSRRSGSWNLWRIGLDGSELKQLTTDSGSLWPISSSLQQFSSTLDGQWILYSSPTPQGFHSIWKVSIEGGEPVRLTDKPSSYPSVSPNGKLFACSYYRTVGEKTQLAVFPIDGGEPLYLFDIPPGTSFTAGMRWTPDGQSIVYRDFGPSLWRQPLAGGEPEKILEFPDEIIYGFEWSFDGRQFAVAHGEGVRDAVLIMNHRK